MAEERRFYVRRESCLAQQLSADDIADAAELAKQEGRASTLAGAEPGDYFVTQIGHAPKVWPRAKFEDLFETGDDEGDEGDDAEE